MPHDDPRSRIRRAVVSSTARCHWATSPPAGRRRWPCGSPGSGPWPSWPGRRAAPAVSTKRVLLIIVMPDGSTLWERRGGFVLVIFTGIMPIAVGALPAAIIAGAMAFPGAAAAQQRDDLRQGESIGNDIGPAIRLLLFRLRRVQPIPALGSHPVAAQLGKARDTPDIRRDVPVARLEEQSLRTVSRQGLRDCRGPDLPRLHLDSRGDPVGLWKGGAAMRPECRSSNGGERAVSPAGSQASGIAWSRAL